MGKQEDRATRQPHAVALRVLRQTLALAQFAHPGVISLVVRRPVPPVVSREGRNAHKFRQTLGIEERRDTPDKKSGTG
jgi:hypothetical protein